MTPRSCITPDEQDTAKIHLRVWLLGLLDDFKIFWICSIIYTLRKSRVTDMPRSLTLHWNKYCGVWLQGPQCLSYPPWSLTWLAPRSLLNILKSPNTFCQGPRWDSLMTKEGHKSHDRLFLSSAQNDATTVLYCTEVIHNFAYSLDPMLTAVQMLFCIQVGPHVDSCADALLHTGWTPCWQLCWCYFAYSLDPMLTSVLMIFCIQFGHHVDSCADAILSNFYLCVVARARRGWRQHKQILIMCLC